MFGAAHNIMVPCKIQTPSLPIPRSVIVVSFFLFFDGDTGAA